MQGTHRAQRDDACFRMEALLHEMPQPDTISSHSIIAGRMTGEGLTSPAMTLQPRPLTPRSMLFESLSVLGVPCVHWKRLTSVRTYTLSRFLHIHRFNHVPVPTAYIQRDKATALRSIPYCSISMTPRGLFALEILRNESANCSNNTITTTIITPLQRYESGRLTKPWLVYLTKRISTSPREKA